MVGSAGSVEYMTSYQIATPKSFSSAHPEDWLKWIKRVEHFLQHQVSQQRVSKSKSGKNEARVRQVQVSTHVYIFINNFMDDLHQEANGVTFEMFQSLYNG